MKPVIMYGNGAQAEMTFYMMTNDMDVSPNVAAFVVPAKYIHTPTLQGIPVVDYAVIQDQYPPDRYDAFVAVGPHQCNEIRENIYNEFKTKGYNLVNMVGKGAWLLNMEYGDNNLIDSGSVSHPFSRLGNDNVIINTAFSHHVQLGSHCFIANAMIGGRTVVEDNVFVGINTVLKDNIRVGKGSIIAAGSLILEDVPPYSVYAPKGTPRRNIDARKLSLFKKKRS